MCISLCLGELVAHSRSERGGALGQDVGMPRAREGGWLIRGAADFHPCV